MAILLKSLRFYSINFLVFFVACLLVVGATSAMAQQSSVAAMEIRFQQMEKEIRRLTGQIEEQQYEIRRLREDVSRVQSELDSVKSSYVAVTSQNMPEIKQNHDTLNNMDRGGAYVLKDQEASASFKNNSSSNDVADNKNNHTLGVLHKSQTGTENAALSGGATRAYDNAYSFIKLRDFDKAEAAFAKFIKDYPNHDLVSNAKYWYGETFYVRKNYERAARIFAEGYQKYPKGPKAASNLLKLGMSLVGMGKKEDACIAFKQLKKEYSKSSIPVLKRTETEMEKINCH